MLDFRNNAIYDWASAAGYTSDDKATLNYVGNYLKPGPSTTGRKYAFKIGGAATRMFVENNTIVGLITSGDPWSIIDHNEPEHRLAQPLTLPAVATDPTQELLPKLLASAGATLPKRDPVDARVVGEIQQGTGRIIDTPSDVGGWPAYASSEPPEDADRDGMPDAWEREYRLNPADADDHRADADGDGYTNLEEYLNATDPQAR